MNDRLPLFTYGTLKPENEKSMIKGLTEGSLPGYLEGYELRDAKSYPIALKNPEEIIWGTIAWLDLQKYDQVLQILDNYEGQGFERNIVEARLCEDSCPINCWVYTCQETMIHNAKALPKIKGGAWNP
jgi:gamma-glutamylcyclotransferase (GGCT)/AIG2-like uncharacterized protein YtfP